MSGPAELYIHEVRRLGPARLTAGMDVYRRLDWRTHRGTHGPLPHYGPTSLPQLAERVGLRGRGGAGFPFHRKARAVLRAAGARSVAPVVVVNGAEGEPPSAKDKALLTRAPHLVLDGALLAAEAFGAHEVVVTVAAGGPGEVSLPAAVAERSRTAPCPVRIVCVPERFVSGESSAQVSAIGGHAALPATRAARASDGGPGGVGGRPTLLCNTETWAQLALAARLGPDAYAVVGTAEEPGTLLLTVNRFGGHPLVVEVPAGAGLATVLTSCDTDPGQGVLVGGYHGAWLRPEAARAVEVSRAGLAAAGGTLGAGAVVALPHDTCPLGETARVLRWLATQSAGQCGPCKRGLPEASAALERIAHGGAGPQAQAAVRRALGSAVGNGACAHPDGTARFVHTALDVFADDVRAHTTGTGCGRAVRGALPLPREHRPRLTVDWSRCTAHGLCAEVAPGLVELGPHGYPMLHGADVAPWQEAAARRAVSQCPSLALRIAGPATG
ncbi:NADH-ubiquinone oxidoreductase-F iron-sulfur binding region domain-containing protein [Streptomyces sp. NBC_01497]|uniref:NADH-ubiquinone oxidoreductase-F iron-sulfur binding region domain-containing protein n=1 Tax=Streptomyces sp. NBC_01497 TaxID=2903885 RepID=UPI002E2F4770|nr:NADH-ubiquinone oxidoreductase-F iron-sulfur binding region domain-containing protein [Streptomyces sp. NBC_01497]